MQNHHFISSWQLPKIILSNRSSYNKRYAFRGRAVQSLGGCLIRMYSKFSSFSIVLFLEKNSGVVIRRWRFGLNVLDWTLIVLVLNFALVFWSGCRTWVSVDFAPPGRSRTNRGSGYLHRRCRGRDRRCGRRRSFL